MAIIVLIYVRVRWEYIRYSVDIGKIHQVFVYSDVPAIVLINVLRIVSIKAYIRYSVDIGKIHQVFVYTQTYR